MEFRLVVKNSNRSTKPDKDIKLLKGCTYNDVQVSLQDFSAFKYYNCQENRLFELITFEVGLARQAVMAAGTTVGCMKLASYAERFKQCRKQLDCDHMDEE